jgi:hypothetical protein
MGFFKKLSSIFSTPSTTSNLLPVEVICKRCGETITGSINLSNDLSIVYGSGENDYTYFCRKVFMGEGHCFQQVEVELTFDRNRRVVERKIKGGKFADDQDRSKSK